MKKTNFIYKILAKKNIWLEQKLKQARMEIKTDEFIKQTLFTTSYLSIGILIIFFLFFSTMEIGLKLKIIFISLPIMFFIIFNYLLKLPDVKIKKLEKEINKEIIFAGRFIVIEIESGINLFKAIDNVSTHYPRTGAIFDEILAKVELGTTLEDAIDETILICPSTNLRKLLWQILNSIRTGSNLNRSLNAALDQIVNEQKIEVVEYGRKLNPLAMFYMMIAVIVPSIGITMFIVLASFIGLKLRLPILLFITFIIGFVQFMFLSIIKSSRPAIEL